jgi:hypothetical protein
VKSKVDTSKLSVEEMRALLLADQIRNRLKGE